MSDTISVELKYTELLVPTDGVYEFVYPTVVGPRYSEKRESQVVPGDEFVMAPYTHEGELARSEFHLSGVVSTGVPLRELASPSHELTVRSTTPGRAEMMLADSERLSGNRDFILRYRLAGEEVATGVLLYQGTDENFFLLMAEPPQVVAADEVPPREYICGHAPGSQSCPTSVLVPRARRVWPRSVVDIDPDGAPGRCRDGRDFRFQPGEGYFARDRLFLIEKSCAGINFMVAAFGMLVFMLFHRIRSVTWALRVLGMSLLTSYLAAAAANTARIAVAMWLAAHPLALRVFNAADVHRIEGIVVYFGGLVLLYQFVLQLDGREALRAE